MGDSSWARPGRPIDPPGWLEEGVLFWEECWATLGCQPWPGLGILEPYTPGFSGASVAELRATRLFRALTSAETSPVTSLSLRVFAKGDKGRCRGCLPRSGQAGEAVGLLAGAVSCLLGPSWPRRA